jgi:hypothetical protein
MSSSELIHKLLVEQGCPLSYQEFMDLRHDTHYMNPNSRRPKGASGTEWSCPVKICGTIRKYTNPVHCVAPECANDPHHYNRKPRRTYWCPICRIHSENEKRCAHDCNNCEIHGPNCIRFKNDTINCRAQNCVSDPHHHDPKKFGHELCKNCSSCHEKGLCYCAKCNKCYLFPDHCSAIECSSDPHHTNRNKFGHQTCFYCGKCHEKNLNYCDKCYKCFSSPHCRDSHCVDPHHQTIEKKYSRICDKCNICHGFSFQFCSICNKCFPDFDSLLRGQREHCIANECKSDPHHMNPQRCNGICNKSGIFEHYMNCPLYNKYCSFCKKCHYVPSGYCKLCNICYPKHMDVAFNHCPKHIFVIL